MNQSRRELVYVSQNLRRHRKGQGLSTYMLAERSGVSRLTITNIENGRADDVRLGTVTRLGQALGFAGWMLCVPPEPETLAA